MTRVMMLVVWACVHCHPQRHVTEAEMSRARCLHIRQQLVAESHRQERMGFPTWTPISAMCMVMP